jgi:hypothetical protein
MALFFTIMHILIIRIKNEFEAEDGVKNLSGPQNTSLTQKVTKHAYKPLLCLSLPPSLPKWLNSLSKYTTNRSRHFTTYSMNPRKVRNQGRAAEGQTDEERQ